MTPVPGSMRAATADLRGAGRQGNRDKAGTGGGLDRPGQRGAQDQISAHEAPGQEPHPRCQDACGEAAHQVEQGAATGAAPAGAPRRRGEAAEGGEGPQEAARTRAWPGSTGSGEGLRPPSALRQSGSRLTSPPPASRHVQRHGPPGNRPPVRSCDPPREGVSGPPAPAAPPGPPAGGRTRVMAGDHGWDGGGGEERAQIFRVGWVRPRGPGRVLAVAAGGAHCSVTPGPGGVGGRWRSWGPPFPWGHPGREPLGSPGRWGFLDARSSGPHALVGGAHRHPRVLGEVTTSAPRVEDRVPCLSGEGGVPVWAYVVVSALASA